MRGRGGLKHQNNFQAYVQEVLGKDVFYTAMKPVPTFVKEQQWQGEATQTQYGWMDTHCQR